MSDQGGPWRFGSLTDDSIPSLLHDLQRAQTKEDWNGVLARAVSELSVCHYARPAHYESEGRKWEYEVASVKLEQLVARGFEAPPHGPKQVFRAEHDAHVIATFGQCRTMAEAVRFLRAAYHLSEGYARSRVRRAVAAGLKLERAPSFGRKPPPKEC